MLNKLRMIFHGCFAVVIRIALLSLKAATCVSKSNGIKISFHLIFEVLSRITIYLRINNVLRAP